MKKNIQDFNFFYWFFKPVIEFTFLCHHNSVTIKGAKNLPKEGGYILAPNHQQAIMEPLAILLTTKRPTVFLARADVFKKPILKKFFTFLKIMPIYRIRDGKENLSKDAEIFRLSRNVILDGHPLCLMAEGRQNNRHQLLPLVKGMFRIASETQKELGDTPLSIVPVGIDFDDYEEPFPNLVVNVGTPIPVQQFMEQYHANEAMALNKMRSTVSAAMVKQMHNIRSKEHYEEIYTLSNIENKYWRHHNRKSNTAWHRFNVRKVISGKYDTLEESLKETLISQTTMVNSAFDKAMAQAREYQEHCKALHISEKLSSEHYSFWITLLHTVLIGGVVTAMCLVGWVRWIIFFCMVCNPLAFFPLHLLSRRWIADPQFRSSVTYGIRLVLAILWVTAFGIVSNCTGGMWLGHKLAEAGVHISHFWWGVIGYDLAFPVAFVSGRIYTYFRHWISSWYYWLLRLFQGARFRQLDALRDELCH